MMRLRCSWHKQFPVAELIASPYRKEEIGLWDIISSLRLQSDYFYNPDSDWFRAIIIETVLD